MSKNNCKTKFLSLLLVMALVITMMPMNVFASSDEKTLIVSGECGDTVEWSLMGTTLIISGSGDMYDYGYRQDTNSWKYAPWSNYEVKSVILNNDITHIGDGAFQYSSVEQISIPDSVTSIGSSAFSGSNLEELSIPSSVDTIGWLAFQGCSKLSSVGGKGSGCSIEYDCGDTIPDYAFFGSEIEYISFPESVTTIGQYAFSQCNNLTTLNIPSTVQIINDRAFGDCENLANVTLEEGVKSLGDSVFYNCQTLDYVSLPESLTSIKSYCFSLCPQLVSVGPSGSGCSIEYGWTESILADSFMYIENLSSVAIADSIKYIEGLAFASNDNLTSIVIPSSVKSMGYYSFGWCDGLKEVYFEGNKPAYIDREVFGKNSVTCYYPYGNTSWDEVSSIDIPSVSWKPWKFGNLVNLECQYTPYSVYVVGDVFKTDELTVNAIYDTGYVEVLSSEDFTVEYDFNSVGYNEVNVKYEDIECSCEVYVHNQEILSLDKSIYPESKHNYNNNETDVQYINYPGADIITVSFSDLTYVEPNIDYIYIIVNGITSTYTGNQLAGKILVFNADSVCIKLDSDEDSSYYGYSFDDIEAKRIIHNWDDGEVTIEPTCDNVGEKTYKCQNCNESKKETIEELGHQYSEEWIVDKDATCTEVGSKSHHCIRCDSQADVTTIPTFEHTYETVLTKATTSNNGYSKQVCSVCDDVKSKTTIYKISSVKISTANYTYTGSVKTPSVTVKDSNGKTLKNGTDYTVSYVSGRTKIGKYKVTVTFKGNYSGSKALYFEIGPKNPSTVKTALYGYDDVKVSWSKVSGASGYKVYYKKSTASAWTYLKATTATSYKKKNLADGVKYNFKVVAYKKVSGNVCENAGKTSSIYTLKKVAGVKAAKSGSKVKVSWTNISGETGYQISQSTSKSKTKVVATYKTTSGKYKKISAKKGKTNYYKVRAYKVVNGKKIYGPWSSVVKYKR